MSKFNYFCRLSSDYPVNWVCFLTYLRSFAGVPSRFVLRFAGCLSSANFESMAWDYGLSVRTYLQIFLTKKLHCSVILPYSLLLERESLLLREKRLADDWISKGEFADEPESERMVVFRDISFLGVLSIKNINLNLRSWKYYPINLFITHFFELRIIIS